MKPYTTSEFIARAKEIFPEYDYSKVIYKSKRDDVLIICPTHGEFTRKPRDMFRNDRKGSGCPDCVKKRRWNTELFITRSQLIHGTRYDYSKSIVQTGRDIITIICSEHGEFLQQADVHAVVGCGCPCCALEQTESKPVSAIKQILMDNNIKFVQEKMFDDCVNINKLRFDFFLEEYDVLIEYDGEFHFKDWGNQITEKVLKQKERDSMKDQYAQENNFKMIRVSYKEDYINIIKQFIDKKFND